MKNGTGLGLSLAALALGVVIGRWSALPPQGAEPSESDAASGEVVARVGEERITRRDFVAAMARFGGDQPGQYRTLEQRRALLDRLVRHASQVEAARAAGYLSDPLVERELERILINRLEEGVMRERLVGLKVTGEEVEAFYQANKEDYARPARSRVAMIRIDKPKKADAKRIEALRQRMGEAIDAVAELPADTRHFGKLAREYSDDRATRYTGGVMGWLVEHPAMKYKWEQPLLDAAFALDEPGQVSPMIETDRALYVARLVERQQAEVQPLARLEQGIRNRLLQEKRAKVREAALDELIAGVPVEVNERLLAAIDPPRAAPVAGAEATPPALPQ